MSECVRSQANAYDGEANVQSVVRVRQRWRSYQAIKSRPPAKLICKVNASADAIRSAPGIEFQKSCDPMADTSVTTQRTNAPIHLKNPDSMKMEQPSFTTISAAAIGAGGNSPARSISATAKFRSISLVATYWTKGALIAISATHRTG